MFLRKTERKGHEVPSAFSENWILGFHMCHNVVWAEEIEAIIPKYGFSFLAEWTEQGQLIINSNNLLIETVEILRKETWYQEIEPYM